MRPHSIAAIALSATLALAGCGGDDEDSGSTTTDDKTAATADAPALDTVLDCLKVGGLDAKDQSSSTGEKIGIDYDGGRLLISFEESPEDAETYASVAEANGETAIVKGSVAITIPDDPDAEADQGAVEECVGS
jgi:hypothetical protein